MHKMYYISSLLLILGSMDCLTTVIGTMYFGAVELNPLLAGIVSTNIFLFVFIKVTITVCVALIFVKTQKTLICTKEKKTKTFIFTYKFLKISYTGMIFFLIMVLINNIFVIVISGIS